MGAGTTFGPGFGQLIRIAIITAVSLTTAAGVYVWSRSLLATILSSML